MKLFSDTGFQAGFNYTGTLSTQPNAGTIVNPLHPLAQPQWRLGQWFCKSNIQDADIGAEGDMLKISTPSQKITAGNGSITLELLASKEYRGHIRKPGEEWPHLLVEQQMEHRPPVGSLKSLKLTCESRLHYSTCHMAEKDDELHCAQANMYFTVFDAEHSDYIWFGVPFYDSRYTIQNYYMQEDIGKDDATHKFIYIIGQKELTDVPFNSGAWIAYDVDLLPYITTGLQKAQSMGYIKNCSLENMALTSMNFGWEMTGEYDSAIELKNLSLEAF